MDGVKVLFHEMSTKKIGYLELVFDADFADLSELQYLSLLKQILGVVAALFRRSYSCERVSPIISTDASHLQDQTDTSS